MSTDSTTLDSITLPKIALTGAQEIVLEAEDLETTVRFYEEILGLTPIAEWGDDRPATWFDGGDGLAIGIWSKQAATNAIHNGRGGAHVHFALRIVPGTVDQVQQRLEQLGQTVTRIEFEHGTLSVYVTDPDGNCVEFMDRPLDANGDPIRFSYGEMKRGKA